MSDRSHDTCPSSLSNMADIIDSWQDPWKITEVPVLPEGTTTLNLSDTKITVLDGATLPRSITSISLTLSPLRTVRNLHLLPNLQMLDLTWSIWLDNFETEFPASLWSLTLSHCRYLQALPKLSHTKLVHLNLYACAALRAIPDLPEGLGSLTLDRCDQVASLPLLPDSLINFSPNVRFAAEGPRMDAPSLLGWYLDPAYTAKYRDHQRANLRKQRFELFHEELMQKAWHPDRVSKWLEHGEGVLDMMMGC